jgi:hypothetical protein
LPTYSLLLPCMLTYPDLVGLSVGRVPRLLGEPIRRRNAI